MAQTMDREILSSDQMATPLVVASGDSHAGPRLEEDLRQYAPKRLLAQFDDFAEEHKKAPAFGAALSGRRQQMPGVEKVFAKLMRNAKTPGHYDIHARLKEMDRDGVAAEVIFHASQNNQPMPFVPGASDLFFEPTGDDLTLVAEGYHIYNRWLADFVSVEPERHVGLAQIPMWDVELAVKELEWAAKAGLRGVNLPAPRRGIADYDNPAWDPFWAACGATGMTLATHAGVPSTGGGWSMMEMGGYPSRRGMPMMIFGGVFERYPDLHLVLTELVVRNWWSYTARELDHQWRQMPGIAKAPSEYMANNVFLGASFPPPAEVVDAVSEGYGDNFVWGRDYPHVEGTYQYEEEEGELNMNRTALRYSFAGTAPKWVRAMVGENCVRAYHLDADALAEVAVRINAPTLDQILTPIDALPDDWFFLGLNESNA